MDSWKSENFGSAGGAKDLNQFNKKEMVIELSALLAAYAQPLSADMLNEMFKGYTGFDFPTKNFYRSGDLEDFLEEQREFVLFQEQPVKTFKANMEYKYTLLHKKAKMALDGNPAMPEAKKPGPRSKLMPLATSGGPSRFGNATSVFDSAPSNRAPFFASQNVYREAPKLDFPKNQHGAPHLADKTTDRSFSISDRDDSPVPAKEARQIQRSVFDDAPKPSAPAMPVYVGFTKQMVNLAVGEDRVSQKNVSFDMDEIKQVLAALFAGVGSKLKRRFLSEELQAVTTANPHTFALKIDGNDEWVVLRKALGHLYKPGDAVIRSVTLADLLWLSQGKCVANREEPYDICKIIHMLPDGAFVCGSTLGANGSEQRMQVISTHLGRFFGEKKPQKVTSVVAGGLYVGIVNNYYARVILTGMDDVNGFNAHSVDFPCVIPAKIDNLWELPEEFSLSQVPGNLYLARLRSHNNLTEDVEKKMLSLVAIEMAFFDEKEGVRLCDWIDGGQFFSDVIAGKQSDEKAITAIRNAFEIRTLAGFFRINDYKAVLEPYASRPAVAGKMFHKLNESVDSLYSAIKDEAKRKELIQKTEDLAYTLIAGLRVADEDVASAILLFNNINAAKPRPN